MRRADMYEHHQIQREALSTRERMSEMLDTLRGSVEVTIPPGTSSGQQLRIHGQGISSGDHIARVMVQIPESPSARERELFEELARIREESDLPR